MHRLYEEIGSDSFEIHEWNDSLEQAKPDLCVMFETYQDSTTERQRLMNAAIADAESALPPGVVYEVRTKLPPFSRWGAAWYYTPPQPAGFEHRVAAQEPLFRRPVDEGQEACGYVVVARLRTPQRSH